MNAPVVLFVVFLLQVSISESRLTVKTPQTSSVAHVGSEVLLQCSFTVTPDVIDVNQLTVTWIQFAMPVAKFIQGEVTEKQKLSLNAEGLKSGNASLLIRRVIIDDGGQYRCTVKHKGEEADVDIYVSVRATPQVSIKLETNLSQSQGMVICEAVSFYPQDISFNITRKGETLKLEKLTSDQSPSRWRLPDESFSARSVYTFDMSDIRNSRDTISCKVTHASVGQPITDSTAPVVPVVSLVGTAVLQNASWVTCRAEHFHPSEVVFTWRRGEEVMKSEIPQASWTPTGTFTAESLLEFTPDSRERVSCQVGHMTGMSERKYVTICGLTAGEITGIVAGVVLANVVVLVLVLVLVLLYRWCLSSVCRMTARDVTWIVAGVLLANVVLLVLVPVLVYRWYLSSVCELIAGEVAGIVAGVLLANVVVLVLVLVLVLLYRWYLYSVKLSLITLSDEVENVPTSLKCTLKGWCLKYVTVEWFENDNLIYIDQKQIDTENGMSVPLIDPSQYKIEELPTERPCCVGESVLTLKIFRKSEDVLGAKFRCRATRIWTRRSVERSYKIPDRRVKPTVSSIQQKSNLELKVTASNFWPQNVTIEWFVDEKMKKEDKLTGNRISGSDSYSAESVCHVTVQECENSQIMARIHHATLNVPIVKTFSKPKGSLQCTINCLTYAKVHFPCVLLCELQGLKSNDKEVKVAWFRSPTSEDAKIKPGSEGWTITSNKDFYVWAQNETFTYKNFLEFIPDEKSNLMMTYTCEVDHDSLKEPFRRVLIPILHGVIGPDVDLQKVVWTKNRCVLHCVIFNLCSPEDFKVTWTRKEKSTDKEVAGTEKWPAEISTVEPWKEADNYKVISQLEFQPTPGSEDMTYCVTVEFPISKTSSIKRELNVRNLPTEQK